MAANSTIHGSRYPSDTANFLTRADGTIDHYFPVLGNCILLFTRGDYGGDLGGGYNQCKHVVDFAGSVAQFRLIIQGNERTTETVYTIQKNGIDTGLTITVPALTDDIYVCEGPEVAFVAGDDFVGHATSASTGDPTSPGILQVTLEMTPANDELHTCFRASGDGADLYGDNGTPRSPVHSTFPLAGSLFHYRSQITQIEDQGELAVTQIPMQMEVRAPGVFTYLQACVDPGADPVTLYFDKNTTPDIGTPDGLLLEDLTNPTTLMSVDTTGSVTVASGDKVSTTGVAPSDGGTVVWAVGVNWAGADGNKLIDFMSTEEPGRDPEYSWDNNKFNYNPTSSGPTKWILNPIGTFWPTLRDEIEGTEDPEGGDIPNLALEPYSAKASFAMTLSHMRVYAATFSTDYVSVGLRVYFLIEGYEGESFVDIDAPGWYLDDNSSDVVEAGQSWCYEVISPFASDEDIRCHLTSITFAYGTSPTPAGTPGPRIVPEPDPIEPEPCVTHRVRCWKITPVDGEVFAYTEHDRDVTYGGCTYKSCGGLSGSASETGLLLGEVGNQELNGFLSELGISAADLLGGRFNNAAVEVWRIPYGGWIYFEDPIQIASGNFGTTTQADGSFKLEALSQSAQMARKSVISVVTETCRFKLGDERCTVHLDSMIVEGVVTELAEDDGYDLTPKKKFTDSTRNDDDAWYDGGTITWLEGKNAGKSTDVKTFLEDGSFVLWDAMVYDIEVGDTYRATPGCNRTKTTCIEKFDNFINFGGFPDLPGPDAIGEFPKWKST